MTKKEKGWQHFVAGNVAGVTGLTVSYPLDTLKIRMQSSDAHRGMIHALRSVVKHEGAPALYRGLLSPVLGYGMINSVAFGSYGAASMAIRARHDGGGPLSLPESMAAGAAAGFAQSFVRAPIERVKTLCQAHAGRYRSSVHCATSVVRRGGALSLMRGVVPTLLREVPQYALYFPIFEMAKRALVPDGGSVDTLSPARLALAGGMAGVLQWLPPIYSVDVVKTRMQAAGPGKYASVLDCVRKIVRADGPGVLVRGLTPALVRAFPLHGTVFMCYEVTMRLLRDDTIHLVDIDRHPHLASSAAAESVAVVGVGVGGVGGGGNDVGAAAQ